MKVTRSLFGLFCISILFGCSQPNDQPTESRPNIVYILADDLGYGEVGYQGQSKIKTPNIDALAASGMIFTNHYTGAPVCAPARSIFLTGMHGGHTYIRGNDEWGHRGEVWNYAKAAEDPNLEGQRPLPEKTLTIAKILQGEGYATGLVGKWGLGAPLSEGIPNNLGFDYFYGYNCQRQAHNLYPPHMWENETKVPLNNEVIVPGTKLDSLADPNDPESYAKYTQSDYAPDMMHAKALGFIEENKDKPFFLYYASPLPHLPIQAPEELVEEYREEFGEEEYYDGNMGYFPNRYPRATYAAMISRLDQHVGEVRKKLEDLGLLENTLIIFTSDNGPTFTGGVDFDYFESSAPFTNGRGRTKGSVYEGGVRVPMVASWPGTIEEGSSSDHISIFYDMMPTFCELIDVEVPEQTDGKSILPTLLGKEQDTHEYLYWEYPEYGGQQAIRMGKWKAVRQNIKSDGNLNIELYDLSTDILERNDLASENPDIVAKMEEIFIKEHIESPIDRFKMEALGDKLSGEQSN
ncbi:arylsulfatase [Algoriphagus sediminis]|uniref:Arylsulfatase n=1 Tax=Algoriphagus sediminis TaxID=3057113 RepID=A0ABT7YC47_9BACT|nr:arylsulfatase [Algoriphagus sediminis]MDN3204076.1 arylsulfatase [Algoriphagus sediminis]